MNILVSLVLVLSLTSINLLMKALALNNSQLDLENFDITKFGSSSNLMIIFSISMLLIINFISYFFLLTRLDLIRVLPLFSTIFVTVPLSSFLIYGERLNITMLIGFVFIMLGVTLTRI